MTAQIRHRRDWAGRDVAVRCDAAPAGILGREYSAAARHRPDIQDGVARRGEIGRRAEPEIVPAADHVRRPGPGIAAGQQCHAAMVVGRPRDRQQPFALQPIGVRGEQRLQGACRHDIDAQPPLPVGILVGDREQAAIRGHRQAPRPLARRRFLLRGLAPLGIIGAQFAIAGGSKQPALPVEGQVADRAGIGGILEDRLARRGIPHTHAAARQAGGKPAAVGRDGQCIYRRRQTRQAAGSAPRRVSNR